MIKPNFLVLNDKLSDSLNANQSNRVWKEFMLVIYNFVEYCGNNIKEDEIAMLTKSLQDWITREDLVYYYEYKNNYKLKGEIGLGDIFYADLGINYKPEFSYGHPVLILEKIHDMVLVVPTTTSKNTIDEAYHPIDNSNGKKQYRKVTKENGFEYTCALLLNNLKVISKGRLIAKKGKLNENITDKGSLFYETKSYIFEKYLPKQYIDNLKLITENNKLISNNELLTSEVERLRSEVNILKVQIEKVLQKAI